MPICRTTRNAGENKGYDKENDVLACVKYMAKRKLFSEPLIQVMAGEYNEACSDRNTLKRAITHKINPNTLTIHKKDCKRARGILVPARLLYPRRTGLKLCKHCMG